MSDDEDGRLARFRAEHPNVTVERAGKAESCVWRAHQRGVAIAVRNERDDLLDVLETWFR